MTGNSYLPGDEGSTAFIYADSKFVNLGTLGGGISTGMHINANGQVVGRSLITNLYPANWHAFLYTDGLMHDLNTLVVSGLQGDVLTTAVGMNDSGQIAAMSCTNDWTVCHAYRLDPIGEEPASNPVDVIEYYNAVFDHYFVTPVAAEIALLDARTAPFQDWSRTGYSFKAYVGVPAPAATVPICRFFNASFAPKSSHFYAAQGTSCEATLAQFPDWKLEDAALFTTALPSASGTCPLGTVPVYRLYNNGMGGAPNHRFVTSPGERQIMIGRGYVPEGDGLGVGMCSTSP
jgi:probable HAF family extracellular repeat protein